MGLRAELADHLRTELGDGVNVYPAGVEVLATPAVVINPSDPYLMPANLSGHSRIAVGLELVIVANRGATEDDALAKLEELRLAVTDALPTMTPPARWTTFGQWGTITIAEVDYASGILDVVVIDQDRS